MTSIRSKFLVGAIGSALVVLSVATMVTYLAVKKSLEVQVDDALRQELALLTSHVEHGSDGTAFDNEDLDMGAYEDGSGFLRVAVGTEEVYSSPDFQGLALQLPTPEKEPQFVWAASSPRIRATAQLVPPRIDQEDLAEAGLPVPLASDLEPVSVLLARHDSAGEEFLRQFRIIAMVVLLASMVSMGVFLRGIGNRALRGLDELANDIATLPADGSSRLDDHARPDEAMPIVTRINELSQRVEQAVERERALGADVAHELRTPLAGLHSLIDVALHRPRDVAEYQSTLRDALDVVHQTETMAEQLLRLHHLEAQGLNGSQVEVDVGSVVGEQCHALEPLAAKRNVTMTVDIANRTRAHADPNTLHMLIANLLGNAASHVDEGGTIRVECTRHESGVQLTIINSGSRVQPADVPRLFDRFSRGDAGRGNTGHHSGLGLAIAKREAELLGATIQITSEHGGDFRVDLILA